MPGTKSQTTVWSHKVSGAARSKLKAKSLALLQSKIRRILIKKIRQQTNTTALLSGLKATVGKGKIVVSNRLGDIAKLSDNLGLPKVIISFELQPKDLELLGRQQKLDKSAPNLALIDKQIIYDQEIAEMSPDHNRANIDSAELPALQARIDDLLAGTPKIAAVPNEENKRLFAPFLPDDRDQAALCAALYTKIAKEKGGLVGLEAAIDQMYEDLAAFPLGMVEHAAKLFLTHHAPARELLRIRRLEERQPGLSLRL